MYISNDRLLFLALLAGTKTFASPTPANIDLSESALEPRIIPLVVALTVDVLPALIEGGAFAGAVADDMFGAMASDEPYKSKETCRVEITSSKNTKFGDWGRCWMKAWPKGQDGGYGAEGNTGGGKVLEDEECPAGSNGLGNSNDDILGDWGIEWRGHGHKDCTDDGTAGWVCRPFLTFHRVFANGTSVALELDVAESGDPGHTEGSGKKYLCNNGREGTGVLSTKEGYDDYHCAVPCKEDMNLPEGGD
ncbi:uncharacterized protein KY384_008596 [Bacidia gigantensis]|uniref:uncharacterized protein n=1 Tax=Bacidia gigantensis TaxID=2732470 RepID=UPI001D052377|nr:uncharacterized protein KY384_008596 [Bacidia gigantensis]KAG8527166.1 hypothetical protein KY384_008596 [Bacidia gigantensis]